jgi:excisionase family DNA binding protein
MNNNYSLSDAAMHLLKVHFLSEHRNEITDLKNEIIQLRASVDNLLTGGAIPHDTESLVSQKDICQFLNISEPTLVKMRRRKEIPFSNTGRKYLYNKSEVSYALNNKGGRR